MSNTITFNITLFRQMYPQFANPTKFPDMMLQVYWDTATCYVSDCNYGSLMNSCRQLALNLMTAHLLSINLLIASGQTSVLVQGSTIDKITVVLTAPPIPNQWQWWLDTTPYGQQLLALLQARSVGGFSVGGLPELSAFRRVGGGFGR